MSWTLLFYKADPGVPPRYSIIFSSEIYLTGFAYLENTVSLYHLSQVRENKTIKQWNERFCHSHELSGRQSVDNTVDAERQQDG